MIKKKKTRMHIIENLYTKSGFMRKDVNRMVQLFIDELRSLLLENGCVELRGLGTFEIRARKGRSNGRNPKTGEKVSIPDYHVVGFRAGKELKTLVKKLPK